MHLLVTDRLTCVRCGPEFGLILLADELADRRVLEGSLGCANCRERYPVRAGFGDFRWPEGAAGTGPGRAPRRVEGGGPEQTPEGGPARTPELAPGPGDDASALPPSDPEEAFRLAALLGVAEGPGLLLVAGGAAAQAERLAAMIEEIEVVALHPALRERPERAGVTRIAADRRLPFRSGSLRGVAWAGGLGEEELDEAVRVLAPGARLVLRPPVEGDAERLIARRLELLLQSSKAVVGLRG